MTHLTTEHEHGVATITLDRPDRRNALDRRAVDDLTMCLRELAARDDIETVVLRGRGPAFSTGADLDEVSTIAESFDRHRWLDLIRSRAALVRTLAVEVATPVACVVDGPATSLGLSLVLASDIVLATGRARFGAPHVRLGLPPDAGLTFLVPERFGAAATSRILLRGGIIDAHEAVRLGFLSRVTRFDAVERDLNAAVQDLRSVPLYLRATVRRSLRLAWVERLDAAIDRELDVAVRAFDPDRFRRRLESRRKRAST